MNGLWQPANYPPTTEDCVLVWLDAGIYALGFYVDGGWDVPDEPLSYRVTHWMPLPEEPR